MFVGARLSVLVGMCVVVAGGLAGLVAPARAQERFPAAVTSVVDGDTVDAQVSGGPALRVRLIGIDTPERGGCGTDQGTAYMEQLALGRNVTLVSDPTQDAIDSFGRSLFYVDRDDGLDVGREMVRAGWAEVFVFERDFDRLSGYLDAEADAEDTGAGVWKRCGGDFHFSRAEELRERRLSAIAFMRRYYRRLSNNQLAAAWGMLSRRMRRDFGPFASWRAGYRRSLGTTVTAARARLFGKRVVVSVRLRARDRDACSRRIVRQYFRGRWILAPRRDSWVAVKVRMRKTGGGQVRLSKSECAPPEPKPPPPPPPPPPPRNCDPSYPTVCIPPPPPDLDCDDIPYSNFTVRGRDPHGFDGEGDGVGCES